MSIGNLHSAVRDESLDRVNTILNRGRFNVNQKKDRKYTALYLAVDFAGWGEAELQTYIPIVRSLLAVRELNVNLTDDKGNSALHVAAMGTTCTETWYRNPSKKIVQMLLNRRETNINSPNKKGDYPLTLAIDNNSAEVAQQLVNDHRIDLTTCGRNALLKTAKKIVFFMSSNELEKFVEKKINTPQLMYSIDSTPLSEEEIRHQLTGKFQEEKDRWECLARSLLNKGVNLQSTLDSISDDSAEHECLRSLD